MGIMQNCWLNNERFYSKFSLGWQLIHYTPVQLIGTLLLIIVITYNGDSFHHYLVQFLLCNT